IKDKLRVGAALDEEETYGITSDPFDQLTHGHIAAGSFGDLDLCAIAHHLDHAVQHIGGIVLGNAALETLQTRAYPSDGAMMIRTLDIDCTVKAALPLGDVVSHIGYKVGIATLTLAHHAVFIV